MPYKKWTPKKCRGSTHLEDPKVRRECPFCARVHLWKLSQTRGGQVQSCSCGATFSAMRTPPWRL